MQPHFKFPILAIENVQDAVLNSDIIVTVTTSPTPVLKREWISLGCHINAVGSCTPTTREIDSPTVVASRVFVDSKEGAFKEAGEILIPIKEGLMTEKDVKGSLSELINKKVNGRVSDYDITLFKSLGIAIEDLVSANYIYNQVKLLNNVGTWAKL